MKYLASFLIVSIATVLQWMLWPVIDPAPALLFYPAIVLAALYANGLSSVFLSAIAVQLFFVSPIGSFHMVWPGDVVRLAVFVGSGLLILLVTHRLAVAVKKAQDAELWLSTTLASIGDAVIATDRDGKISFMNPVAEGLTEWSLAEAKGKPLSQVFHIINRQTREIVENPVTKVMSEGGTVGLAADTVIVGRNGTEVIIEDSAAPIRSSTDRPIEGVVFVFRDSSEKYSQETKLSETFDRLQSSETRMRNILENALDAVVSMDDRGLITHWNSQAEKVFGFTRAEAVGKRMSETIIPHQYREAHERGMKHYLASGEGKVLNRRIEITALRRDGTEFPIELSITPIKVGSQMSFAAFIRDISDQQRLKRELLLKSDALENSLNGFDIVDEKGHFVYANRAYLSMWGYDNLDELLETSPVSHCADPTMPEKIIGTLKEKGECDVEFVGRRKDGSTFDVRMWARLAHDSEGTEVYPSTSIDITERKIAERELKASKEAAEKANRAKSQFLANMSHEIRTPVGIIQGFAELLCEFEGLPPDQQRWVQTISRNSRLLTNVIGEILDLSRVEANMLEIERATFPLNDVIHDISSSMQFKAEEKGIALEISVDEDVPSMIHTDPTRLRQILINLIGNAIKFTERGSVKVHFTSVKNGAKSTAIKVRISDTGIGMTQEQQEKVFQPFVQGDSTTTRRFGGAGLGLAISKRLAMALNGDVQLIQSAPYQGTTFEVTVCCASNDQQEISAPRSASQNTMNGLLQGKRLLLVEDLPDNQILIQRLLSDLGASIETANNGREGVEKAAAEAFDLILMDIQMPEMDGYAALKAIRASGQQLPIVALTAHALKEERDRAQRAGFDDYLTKPVTKSVLVQTIFNRLKERKKSEFVERTF